MTDDPFDKPLTAHDLVEIYAATNAIEADRVILLLNEEGIEAQCRETSLPAFPTSGTSRHLVTVFQQDRDKANQLIAQAIEDEILSKQGALI